MHCLRPVRHQHGPCPHEYLPRTDHGQVRLRFRATMTHRTQKVRIDAGQGPRVQPVILPRALSDQTYIPRGGYDHFVTERLQLPAHPRPSDPRPPTPLGIPPREWGLTTSYSIGPAVGVNESS